MRRLSTVLAAGAALLAAPAACLLAPATASADQAVVSATIYTGSQAGITSETVTLAALGNCPVYTGASPFLLDPGNTPYQPAAGSSWSLDTIVECGLRIPAAAITGVSVQSAQRGFEAPLSAADLADPSRYDDPTAPGALPVISLDGGQNQVTYARPERSPSDANAGDRVVDTGPVTIAVYENAPPLQVRVTAHRVAGNATTLQEQFTATVTDAAGQPVSLAGLSWSWSFGDGTSSAQAAPRHAFPLGRWFVTAVVTDRASGTGGTDTIPVSVDSHALSGSADRSGAGRRRTGSSPSGLVTGAGSVRDHGRSSPHAPTHHTSSRAQGSAVGHSSTPGTATTRAASTSPATPVTGAAPTATTPPASPARPARHRPSRGRRARRFSRVPPVLPGRVVRGLLIADVTPVAPAASRLATPAVASAPALVRAATRSPAGFSGPIAAGLILVLLALGAGREQRGRHRWRGLRPAP